MKIILDQIEFILPEATFRLVSSSHALGRVKKANEVSKNIWNYHIKFEDSLIECEIKYGRNQVNRIQCACGRSNTKHPCLHAWIAAYWHFKEVVQPKTKTVENPNSFKLTNFDFSEFSQEELIQFIKLILKLDKSLHRWTQLLLSKAYKEEELYTFCIHILNSFEANETSKKPPHKLKTYKEQIQLIEFIYDQSIQNYIDADINSAYYKCLACIIKTDGWLSLYQQNNHLKLLRLNDNLHKAIEQILKGIKSAELYESLTKYTLSVLSETKHLIRHKSDNLYSILFNTANTKLQKKSITELILTKINSREIFEANELEGLLFLVNTLDLKDFKNLLKQDLGTHISNQTWLMALDYFKENQLIQAFEEHHSLIIQYIQNKDVKIKTAENILAYLLTSNQIEKCTIKAKEYSILLSNFNFAKLYFSTQEDKYLSVISFVADYKTSNKVQDNNYILDVLSYIEDKDLLVQELEIIGSLELTMQYDLNLFRSHWDRLLTIYYKLSEEYLNTHVGTQAFNYIDTIRKHIFKHGKKSMSEEYFNEVQKLFPERTKLLNTN